MLKLGEKVEGGLIASMPFESQEDAMEWIQLYWKDIGYVSTYFNIKDGEWYIISR